MLTCGDMTRIDTFRRRVIWLLQRVRMNMTLFPNTASNTFQQWSHNRYSKCSFIKTVLWVLLIKFFFKRLKWHNCYSQSWQWYWWLFWISCKIIETNDWQGFKPLRIVYLQSGCSIICWMQGFATGYPSPPLLILPKDYWQFILPNSQTTGHNTLQPSLET